MSKETRRAVFVISVAAELAGMHPQTLRIYERKGLIDPYRTPGGTRRYSQEDINRLSDIQQLTDSGLNLEGVRQVMAYRDAVARLENRVAALEHQITMMNRESEQRVREVHQSYRHEIVLRTEMLPEKKSR